MKMITVIIQPYRLDHVCAALSEVGILGVSVTECCGYGRQRGLRKIHSGDDPARLRPLGAGPQGRARRNQAAADQQSAEPSGCPKRDHPARRKRPTHACRGPCYGWPARLAPRCYRVRGVGTPPGHRMPSMIFDGNQGVEYPATPIATATSPTQSSPCAARMCAWRSCPIPIGPQSPPEPTSSLSGCSFIS